MVVTAAKVSVVAFRIVTSLAVKVGGLRRILEKKT